MPEKQFLDTSTIRQENTLDTGRLHYCNIKLYEKCESVEWAPGAICNNIIALILFLNIVVLENVICHEQENLCTLT